MGNNTRKRNKKRKSRNSSGNDSENHNSKQRKQRGPSGDQPESTPVSDILSWTNSILYGDEDLSIDKSVFEEDSADSDSSENSNMADGNSQDEPTNRDIMNCLKGLSGRLEAVEKKLSGIDKIEQRMSSFEKEIKGIWLAIDDKMKKVDDRVTRLENAADGADIHSAQVASRVEVLEKEKERLQDDLAYVKSQTMRNNLIFVGVPEDNTGGRETPDRTESILRLHLQNAMKIAKETAESIKFERIHRSPSAPQAGKVRSIVAKFTFFRDREYVRRQWKSLNGTNFNVFEQFPPEVVRKRKALVPKMKEERQKGNTSWIAYDTLYVNGKPVQK